ncbi:sensor domain-containing diguanylate cyclase [Yunchengibacter salinarum]|uniref:sensor domain-containing diguanylate cyclase n=1 Tax=Yunchengibacter salinarum TaxID=3133399 RepID=UPI0035B6228D
MTASESLAIRVSAYGDLLAVSEPGRLLADLWGAGDETLKTLVNRALESGSPVDDRYRVSEVTKLWLCAVPEGEACTVMARDTTLMDNVTEALMTSRTLLKQLLDQSVDLAFEVDERQNFTFLTPPIAFSYHTEDWLGAHAIDVFWPRGNAPSRNPFMSRTEESFDAIPVRFHGEKTRWLHFHVSPILSDGGVFMGVRGTCRDVSDSIKREREMRQTNLRLTVQQRITHIINSAASSEDLLDEAASAMRDLLRADSAWILVSYGRGLVPAAVEGGPITLDVKSLWRQVNGAPGQTLFKLGHRSSDFAGREQGPFEIPDTLPGAAEHMVQPVSSAGEAAASDTGFLAVRLGSEEQLAGVAILGRNTAISPWSEQEEDLMAAIADTLTAALGKATLTDELHRLASRDELTGLLNRRAIKEQVNRRLSHQKKTGTLGTLIFIDLDHFKEVNDTLGHRAGDRALEMVARSLSDDIRSCDFAGRYGGDEFVVWLEDAGEAEAAQKARGLIADMPRIREKLGRAGLKLSASIGICQSSADEEGDFDTLAERADRALYAVKDRGRSDFAYARVDGITLRGRRTGGLGRRRHADGDGNGDRSQDAGTAGGDTPPATSESGHA